MELLSWTVGYFKVINPKAGVAEIIQEILILE
jgi:hypothetical protein